MKILVTGGQGFIGGHVVDNLLANDHHVTVFDRRMKDNWPTDWLKAAKQGRLSFFLGSVTSRESVFSAVEACDAFVNLAGLLGTSELLKRADDAVRVNIRGAINVFEAAQRFSKPGLQTSVGNYWMNNPYSITKHAAERLALMYTQSGADIRVLRIMNAYGPRQAPYPVRKFFPNVVIQALRNELITIYGDGEQVMDFVYVKDVADIIVRLTVKEKVPSRVYVAGSGDHRTINETVAELVEVANSQSKIRHVAMRVGETERAVVTTTVLDQLNLTRAIKFYPNDLTDRSVAFEQTIEWYHAHLEDFAPCTPRE